MSAHDLDKTIAWSTDRYRMCQSVRNQVAIQMLANHANHVLVGRHRKK